MRGGRARDVGGAVPPLGLSGSGAARALPYVAATAPWTLLRPARAGDAAAVARLVLVLSTLRRACDVLAAELAPFLPRASERLAEALRRLDPDRGRELFRKPASPQSPPPEDVAVPPAPRRGAT